MLKFRQKRYLFVSILVSFICVTAAHAQQFTCNLKEGGRGQVLFLSYFRDGKITITPNFEGPLDWYEMGFGTGETVTGIGYFKNKDSRYTIESIKGVTYYNDNWELERSEGQDNWSFTVKNKNKTFLLICTYRAGDNTDFSSKEITSMKVHDKEALNCKDSASKIARELASPVGEGKPGDKTPLLKEDKKCPGCCATM